jgi:hypothetical protein
MLTQQLLITTDTIQAHVSIPARIVSKQNGEYVIKKTEGENGWISGICDGGGTC